MSMTRYIERSFKDVGRVLWQVLLPCAELRIVRVTTTIVVWFEKKRKEKNPHGIIKAPFVKKG